VQRYPFEAVQIIKPNLGRLDVSIASLLKFTYSLSIELNIIYLIVGFSKYMYVYINTSI